MKTKKELNVLKEEVETLNKKLDELSEDELEQVSGGSTDESIDDILQRQRDDIRRALEGLLNPPAAYTHAFDTNKPSPLPSDK